MCFKLYHINLNIKNLKYLFQLKWTSSMIIIAKKFLAKKLFKTIFLLILGYNIGTGQKFQFSELRCFGRSFGGSGLFINQTEATN
jgi:hypothetical protein